MSCTILVHECTIYMVNDKILQHLSAPPVELSRTISEGQPTDTDISGSFRFNAPPFPGQSADSCRLFKCPIFSTGQAEAESFLALISTSAVAMTWNIIGSHVFNSYGKSYEKTNEIRQVLGRYDELM